MASDTEALQQIPSADMEEEALGLSEPTPPSPRDRGLIETIRRLSRRLSGTALVNPSSKPPRRPIYSYDGDTGDMVVGKTRVPDLVNAYGTPLYVYDVNRISENYEEFMTALKTVKNFSLNYAVKANSTLGVLDVLKRLGSGFDVVSGGEIARCLQVGIDPRKIIFSGCGKARDEVKLAMESKVGLINVESLQELELIESVAREIKAPTPQDISIRINPGIVLTEEQSVHAPALTAVATAKFGVPFSEASEFFARAKASAYVTIRGLACHLGSGINTIEPYITARDKLLALADELRNENRVWIEHINMGGGFAAPGSSAIAPDISAWVEKLSKPISDRGLRIIIEPGRSILSDAGILFTSVKYIKNVDVSNRPSSRRSSISLATNQVITPTPTGSGGFFGSGFVPPGQGPVTRCYAIVDAGFNDFGRPSVYGTAHRVLPTKGASQSESGTGEHKYDVVGPISETSDCLAKELVLQIKLEPGSILAITDSGAYGLTMASNYCSRRRPAEVLVHGDGNHSLIRERDTWEQLFQNERQSIGLKLPARSDLQDLEEGSETSSQINQ